MHGCENDNWLCPDRIFLTHVAVTTLISSPVDADYNVLYQQLEIRLPSEVASDGFLAFRLDQ